MKHPSRMTLREKNHDSGIQRKYSVSQSGKYKSRPKIRPSLSGDLFRPEVNKEGAAVDLIGTDNNNRTGSATSTASPSGPPGITQQSSRGVYETAL